MTVVSKEEPDGVALLLESSGFESAKVYRRALYDAGIPATVFSVDDIQKEYKRLSSLEVAIIAVFDDTCGNKIQIAQTL